MAMDREQFLLMKLAEEASDVTHLALKAAQFGMSEKHPELQETNKARLHNELNDLLVIVDLLDAEFDFNFEKPLDYKENKLPKLDKYFNYSKQLGKVQT